MRPSWVVQDEYAESFERVGDDLDEGWLEHYVERGITELAQWLARRAAFEDFLDGGATA
jgi:hypothetical protein